MNITVEVPTPRFNLGDVVRHPNTANGGAWLYRVVGRCYEGQWSTTGDRPVVMATSAYYALAILPGSVHNDASATPYPGPFDTTDNVHVISIPELDEGLPWTDPSSSARGSADGPARPRGELVPAGEEADDGLD